MGKCPFLEDIYYICLQPLARWVAIIFCSPGRNFARFIVLLLVSTPLSKRGRIVQSSFLRFSRNFP